MLDKAKLREAFVEIQTKDFTGVTQKQKAAAHQLIHEAARLVASDTTLIVEKVNGEWPEWAALLVTAVTPTFNSHLLNENIGFALLDALLAYQGDAEK